jgi:hypothetical protein
MWTRVLWLRAHSRVGPLAHIQNLQPFESKGPNLRYTLYTVPQRNISLFAPHGWRWAGSHATRLSELDITLSMPAFLNGTLGTPFYKEDVSFRILKPFKNWQIQKGSRLFGTGTWYSCMGHSQPKKGKPQCNP